MGLDFKKPARFTLSANEIRQYGECPRKRYYASRDCLAIRPKKTNKNLAIGKLVHSALQYYYTGIDRIIKEAGLVKPTKEQVANMLELYADYVIPTIDENGEPLEWDASDMAIYETVTEYYRDQIVEDLVKYEIEMCELSFSMQDWPIEDVMFHGYIDMVVRERDTGLVWFFEHKTCTSFRPEIYNRFDIQLHIYDAYGKSKYGNEFGGMILNQIKKAKTSKGFGILRNEYSYDEAERDSFLLWLTKKTEGLVSPHNRHEPCNSYMGCKMCEYAAICMKYGYAIPKTTAEVTENSFFKTEEGEIMYVHNPREEEEAE